MIDIESIKRFDDTRVIVIYKVWASCMCQHARRSLVIDTDKDLTQEEIMTYIRTKAATRIDTI